MTIHNHRSTRLRLGAILVAVVALLGGLAVVASPAEAQESSESTVAGVGRLRAVGTGDVDIDMAGTIRLRVDGNVRIVDRAGDMEVRIAGETAARQAGVDVALQDFNGRVVVHGSGFSIAVDGRVALFARGRGQADLIGNGWYQANNGERMPWDGAIRIGDDSSASAG